MWNYGIADFCLFFSLFFLVMSNGYLDILGDGTQMKSMCTLRNINLKVIDLLMEYKVL